MKDKTEVRPHKWERVFGRGRRDVIEFFDDGFLVVKLSSVRGFKLIFYKVY